MTALKEILIKRIEATGPITIADYMSECLLHPEHGYYTGERVFGSAGDFVTAPEISQMFGEMLGLWLADRWLKLGKPGQINLVEFGPGRGTLMEDILRATEPVEGFHKAVTVHFIEASPQLRAQQAKKVADANWHDDLSTVPEGNCLIIANEFFDALPIHQFEKHEGKWCERRVHAENGELQLVLTEAGPKFALTDPGLHDSPNGSILETCPMGLSIAGSIAERIAASGGAALFIDYGFRKTAVGDSFQAVKAHEFCDPLTEPGKADLTAHVAFDQLIAAATEKGVAAFGPAMQGGFLMALGMGQRAQQLATAVDEEGQQRILSELKRLTAQDEMGTLFKVLALQEPRMAAPPGF